MSSVSHAAVTSPVSPMTATPPSADRTRACNGVVGTVAPFWSSSRRGGHVAQGARLVVVDVDELRQPGDREDLPVVIGQPVGRQCATVPAGPRQQAHEQGGGPGNDVVDGGAGEGGGRRLRRP